LFVLDLNGLPLLIGISSAITWRQAARVRERTLAWAPISAVPSTSTFWLSYRALAGL